MSEELDRVLTKIHAGEALTPEETAILRATVDSLVAFGAAALRAMAEALAAFSATMAELVASWETSRQ